MIVPKMAAQRPNRGLPVTAQTLALYVMGSDTIMQGVRVRKMQPGRGIKLG